MFRMIRCDESSEVGDRLVVLPHPFRELLPSGFKQVLVDGLILLSFKLLYFGPQELGRPLVLCSG